MSANTTPIFTLTPVIGEVTCSDANTARDGTGTLATVITGTTNGTRISRISITATVTTTAGMVRLFIDNGAGTIRLWREVAVTAITVGANTAGFQSIIYLPGEQALILPNGYVLKAGTHNAEAFSVIAEGGNY